MTFVLHVYVFCRYATLEIRTRIEENSWCVDLVKKQLSIGLALCQQLSTSVYNSAIKRTKEQKRMSRMINRLTCISINYLFMYVLERQMVNVVYRQAILHLDIFSNFFSLSNWHLCLKHIYEVSSNRRERRERPTDRDRRKLTIYQTDRVVRSFSTGGVTQKGRKEYNKCVNTSQVERWMLKERRRIDHHLVMTLSLIHIWRCRRRG